MPNPSGHLHKDICNPVRPGGGGSGGRSDNLSNPLEEVIIPLFLNMKIFLKCDGKRNQEKFSLRNTLNCIKPGVIKHFRENVIVNTLTLILLLLDSLHVIINTYIEKKKNVR